MGRAGLREPALLVVQRTEVPERDRLEPPIADLVEDGERALEQHARLGGRATLVLEQAQVGQEHTLCPAISDLAEEAQGSRVVLVSLLVALHVVAQSADV